MTLNRVHPLSGAVEESGSCNLIRVDLRLIAEKLLAQRDVNDG